MTTNMGVKAWIGSIGRGYFPGRRQGAAKITLMVFGTILAVAIFCAYHILPFYYYYFELQEHFHSLVRVASVHTDQELRVKIRDYLRRMDIPAVVDDVKIERAAGRILIELRYEEVFFVTFRGEEHDLHTFKFHVKAEGEV